MFPKIEVPFPVVVDEVWVVELVPDEVVVYDTVSGGVVVVYRLRMRPEMDTLPAEEMSSMRSTAFHVMGVTGSESVTVLGTVSIMRWKRVLHVDWKVASSEMLSIVALLSET